MGDISSTEMQKAIKAAAEASQKFADEWQKIAKALAEAIAAIDWDEIKRCVKEARKDNALECDSRDWPVKNIERIKEMDAAKLADFLVKCGAEVPPEFCDVICKAITDCKGCRYYGETGDKKAWKIWLESEDSGALGDEHTRDRRQHQILLQTEEPDPAHAGGRDRRQLGDHEQVG